MDHFSKRLEKKDFFALSLSSTQLIFLIEIIVNTDSYRKTRQFAFTPTLSLNTVDPRPLLSFTKPQFAAFSDQKNQNVHS
jgi:hypothetical protein